MDNAYAPIPMRPLTMRGVFGITWAIMKRGFFGAVMFSLIFTLIMLLACALGCAPIIAGIMNSTEGLSGAFAAAIVLGVLLLLIVSLADALLLQPMLTGGIYTEMSMRVAGQASGLGRMFKRCRHIFKRFFTLNLCVGVGNIAVNIIVSLINSIFSSIITVAGFNSALRSVIYDSLSGIINGGLTEDIYSFDIDPAFGTLAIALTALLCIIRLAVSTCVSAPLSFAYPAAVNEGKRNFAALGRSITLGFKRYGRIIAARLIFSAVNALAALLLIVPAVLIISAGEFTPAAIAAIVLIALIYIFAAAVFRCYGAALNTVLYFDAKVRGSAPAAQAQPQAAAPFAPQGEAQNAPEAEFIIYDPALDEQADDSQDPTAL